MKNNNLFLLRRKITFVLIIILAAAGISFFTVRAAQKYVRNLVDRSLNNNLHNLVREAVRDEVKSYMESSRELEIADNPKTVAIQEKEGNLRKESFSGDDSNPADSLNKEIREAIKSELEHYTAGGLEINAIIAEGLKKSRMSLEEKNNYSKKEFIQLADSGSIDRDEDESEGLNVSAGKETSIERTLVQKGGMLLPKGTLQIEPSLTVAHFSSNRINIQGFSILPVLVIGEISTESVKRDVFIEAISLKYGMLNNLQGEVSVPYRFEYDRVTDNLGAESVRKEADIGDIVFGLSRQLAYERGIVPDLVGALTIKTNTGKDPYNRDIGLGTGHWGLKGTLIAAKSSDPAVVFGTLSYTWNFKRKINNFGKVEPGSTIGLSLGTAIALSYQTAINFQFEQNVTFKMKKDGIPVNGSFLNSASFKGGFTWAANEKSSIDFSTSIGLTTDAPDFVVELRFPFTF